MVGFSLWHIHPEFALVGILGSLALALWLLIAVSYAIARRRDIEPWDWLMIIFGARHRCLGLYRILSLHSC
jgi:hypothetical protein